MELEGETEEEHAERMDKLWKETADNITAELHHLWDRGVRTAWIVYHDGGYKQGRVLHTILRAISEQSQGPFSEPL